MTGDTGEEPDSDETAAGGGSALVDRWTGLDRGWQALALGVVIVAAHAAGQAAGVF